MSIDALLCIYGGLSNPFRFGTLNVGYVRGSYLFSVQRALVSLHESNTLNTSKYCTIDYKLFLHV